MIAPTSPLDPPLDAYRSPHQAMPKASTCLQFEFTPDDAVAAAVTGGGSVAVPRPVTIRLPDLHKLLEGEAEILEQLVKRYNVPDKHR